MKRSIIIVTAVLLFGLIGGVVYVYRPSKDALPRTSQDERRAASGEKSAGNIYRLYYGNTNIGSDFDCSIVTSLERSFPVDLTLEQLLEELVYGPTESERASGYTSMFSTSTEGIIRSVRVNNDVVYVDVADLRQVLPNASASCASAAFFASLEETITDYFTATTPDQHTQEYVYYSMEGNARDFYEFMQLNCPDELEGCAAVGDERVRNVSVNPDQLVAAPLTVTGEARGTWFFEASFPVKLIDADGNELAVSPAQAQKDWMTEDFVPFRVELSFENPMTDSGRLVLVKDNPSGLPEQDASISIPIRFR